jgi:hypothetical protein
MLVPAPCLLSVSIYPLLPNHHTLNTMPADAAAVIVLTPCTLQWPAVGSWWTIMLVFAFQSGAVVGSAPPLYQLPQPKLGLSLLLLLQSCSPLACCGGLPSAPGGPSWSKLGLSLPLLLLLL